MHEISVYSSDMLSAYMCMLIPDSLYSFRSSSLWWFWPFSLNLILKVQNMIRILVLQETKLTVGHQGDVHIHARILANTHAHTVTNIHTYTHNANMLQILIYRRKSGTIEQCLVELTRWYEKFYIKLFLLCYCWFWHMEITTPMFICKMRTCARSSGHQH